MSRFKSEVTNFIGRHKIQLVTVIQH